MNSGIRKYIGDKAFYKMVMTVAIPMIAQNIVTNLVNLIDNVMVGQLGTEMMSGVSIVGQLMFVYNLCTFGAIAGAGIFGSQFAGKKDHEGIRNTFRFKLLVCIAIAFLGIGVFLLAGDRLIGLYLTDDGTSDLALTLDSGSIYLKIMLLGLLPFCFSQAYSGTLREQGQTLVPMISSIAATFINMALNYVLIFGHFGAPRLDVAGAAIATVISRFAEMGILVVWTHRNSARYPFIKGAYRGFRIPGALAWEITKRGFPLLLNESLWSVARAAVTQCYSTRGLTAVAAINIASTVEHLFSVAVMSFGSTVGIIVGQKLGAGEIEEAVDTDRKIITFAIACSVLVGGLLACAAPLFPKLYNTSEEAKALAVSIMRVAAVFLPVQVFYNTTYFTLRCGGKTFITFLFDSVYMVLVNYPVAIVLSRFTGLPILPIYICVQGADILKVILGWVLVRKRIWVNRIVD